MILAPMGEKLHTFHDQNFECVVVEGSPSTTTLLKVCHDHRFKSMVVEG